MSEIKHVVINLPDRVECKRCGLRVSYGKHMPASKWEKFVRKFEEEHNPLQHA